MSSMFNVRGAWAFFIAVFLNAFVDLGHKIVIQNTLFKVYDGPEQVILTAIINALILLPFIVLFVSAGRCSDSLPKHRVMKISAWAAVGLTLALTAFYALGWFWAAFAMTFLLAAQSAYYSPAKFAYLRGLFGKEKLAQANGLTSAISIIAILTGTFAFSILFERFYTPEHLSPQEIIQTLVPLAGLLVLSSIVELVMMYRIPQVDGFETAEIPPRTSITASIHSTLEPALRSEVIRLSIIGLAMFWSIGQVMLATFPAFAKTQIGETNTIVIQAILAASGIGIALGSSIASRVSRNYIETGLIPIGASMIALGLFILPNLEQSLFMGLSFFIIGLGGGLFIVPLNALIQFNANEGTLGRTLAANNLIQNLAMLTFLLLTVGFSFAGFSSKSVLQCLAVFAFVCGAYTVYKLPQSLMRFLLAYVMKQRYRVNVQGMKNLPSDGGVLLLGNHISWIDWAVVQLACPRPVQFVMHKSIYERWYLSWFFKLFGCVPIEAGTSSKGSLATVSKLLDEGKVVCLFPEGAISANGQLAEFKKGFERAAQACETDIAIVPFYLHGLWGSQWSLSSEKMKRQTRSGWRRDLVVAFGKAQEKTSHAQHIKQQVFELSISSWQAYAETLPTLAEAWVQSCKRQGRALAIAESRGTTLSATRALSVAMSFSSRIKNISPEQNIGVLLPTSAGAVLSNMASLMLGKTIVNLNYSASASAISSAIEQAEIKTIYSSRIFLKKLEAKGIHLEESLNTCKLVYLEDMKEEIGKLEFIRNCALIKLLPTWLLQHVILRKQNRQGCAAILFSSGSEGEPKGVCLSNMNIMANLKQISAVLNMHDKDVVMASLPLFHAFGLTVTQFLPLIEGLPMICHPDPTDALGIAKAAAKYRASIMCGTSTFLRLFAKNSRVQAMMLENLRLVISGAERLKPEVREAFQAKFNKQVLEGYGATETTPVASVNMPDHLDVNSWKVQKGQKHNTVGMPLPGTSFKIVDPETYEELATGEDGMILIGGAQVMQGYLKQAEKTAKVIIEQEGTRWYVSGDKGHVDEDGFLSIVDRYSRFAKIAGEMLSLSSVEQQIQHTLAEQYDEFDCIAVNIEDSKKGERIVLLVEQAIELNTLKSAMLAAGSNALMIPSAIVLCDTLPKLGSGKVDFSEAKRIALLSIH